MFEKFSRSWGLVKASASVLRSDKELLLFPVVSAVCTAIVAATFIVPAIGLRIFDGSERASSRCCSGSRSTCASTS